MSDAIDTQGRCLCGAVTLHVSAHDPHVDVCHCRMCRVWSGGPMMAVTASRAPRVDGEADVAIYASSDWAERGFCRHCGTHLFYRLKSGEHYAIPVGLMGDTSPWEMTLQIFTDEQPQYYAFANDTRTMTGQEVFEMFTGDASS